MSTISKRILFVVFSLFAGSIIAFSAVVADSFNVCLEDGITPCRWFVTGTSDWISAPPPFPGEVQASTAPNPQNAPVANVVIRGWDRNRCMFIKAEDKCNSGSCGTQYAFITSPPAGIDYFATKHVARSSQEEENWFTSASGLHTGKPFFNGTAYGCG